MQLQNKGCAVCLSNRCQKEKKFTFACCTEDYSDIFKNTILRQACEKTSSLSILFHSETLFPDHCDMKENVFTQYYRVSLAEHS